MSVFLLGAHATRAEEDLRETPARSFSLADALAYALAHQPQIRAALAELDARYAEVRGERARWLPRLGATAQIFAATDNNSSAAFLNVPETDLSRVGGTPARTTDTTRWTPAASTLAGVSVDQQIWDFGRTAALTALADARVGIARADTSQARLDVELGVDEAFHGVLAAKAVLTATEDAYTRAITHRDYAQAGVKSGLLPPIDLTRAQAAVALLEVRLVRARSGVAVSQAVLAAAIGSDAIAVDAAATPDDDGPAPAFDQVMHEAASKNPAVLAARSQLSLQRANTRSVTSGFFPNVWASGGISGRAGGEAPTNGSIPYGNGWLPDVANWHLGLVLAWNAFDGRLIAQRSASRSRERAAQARLEGARLDVGLAARRAWLDLQTSLKAPCRACRPRSSPRARTKRKPRRASTRGSAPSSSSPTRRTCASMPISSWPSVSSPSRVRVRRSPAPWARRPRVRPIEDIHE